LLSPSTFSSSQFFLAVFADPINASEILGIPATIFFLPEALIPPDNLLPGEIEALLGLGEGCFLAVGDGCRYLDGTIIAASRETLRFSSLAETKLGTTHFDGTGELDLFPFPAGEGSLSAETLVNLPVDTDLFAVAGDENLAGAGKFSRFASGCLALFNFCC
jgi:hypothetical protein